MLFQCLSSLLLSLPVIQVLLSVPVFLPILDLSPHSYNLIHSSHSFIIFHILYPYFPNFCLLSFIQKGFFMSSLSSVTLPSVLTHLHPFLIFALLLSFSVIFNLSDWNVLLHLDLCLLLLWLPFPFVLFVPFHILSLISYFFWLPSPNVSPWLFPISSLFCL